MKTLAHYSTGRENNFNLIRIIAAACVLISHSYSCAIGNGAPEPLSSILPGYNLGRLAVWTFFAISGFFISQSFERRRHLGDFVLARVLRIYPGLLVALLITAFLIAPVLTELSLHDYFRGGIPFLYVASNLTLKWRMSDLPGLFLHNPFGPKVNGPLWTLFYEVLCYAMVVLLGLLALLSKRVLPIFFILYFPLYLFTTYRDHISPFMKGHDLIFYLHELTLPFVMGMLYFRYRQNVPYHWGIATLCAALTFILLGTAYFIPLFIILWSYIIIYLGFLPSGKMHAYNKLGDYSYGTYIYAWPIQQSSVHLFPGITATELSTIALPVTLICAVISWHLIEKRALKLRNAFVRQK